MYYNLVVLELPTDLMSTCVAPLSETMGVEEHAEADRSLQDKPVDKQLSADHLSTCVALRFTLL